jgi:GNAT superfamily N-acetyltransferase
MVEIQQIDLNSNKQIQEFVQFHYDLYKGCPQWVPPFIVDIKMMLNKKKHPFYQHSDADFFVARRDGKIVGRIAAIENRPYNQYHDSKQASFYLFDSIDDQEVANALFDTTAEWARKRGLNRLVGPKGFSGLDGYGILAEGFEHRQMMNMMNYNFEYYLRLFETYGFGRENDFVSCYIKTDDFKIPEKVREISRRINERGTFWVKRFKNKKEMVSWGPQIGETYNKSFINNWEYYPLTPQEVKFSIDNVLIVALPEFIKLIMHNDDVIGFLFTFPDISAAMQRHGGHLYPWALLDFMIEMKRTKWISLNGVGVLPEYHGRGANALLYTETELTMRSSGFIHAEQTQMADTAVQVRKDMETLGARIYKRHRIFSKDI